MSRQDAATVVICARNAAGTIARAVASAAAQSERLILVDDFSTDDTVARARAVAPITVVCPATHGAMGQTRQRGLDAVTTPYVIWLDADDEFLPGRVERLIGALDRDEADIAADGVELIDGESGTPRAIVDIPPFARRAPVRLFERMYLPGPGVIAVRTAVARRIGYDPGLHGAEDVDFLLRALAQGARPRLLGETGYRLYAYAGSLSRGRDRQRQMYRLALAKHAYESIDELYALCGMSRTIATWALVSIAMFREDYPAALAFIDRHGREAETCAEIVEPEGPCPYPEAWRIAFARGTAHLLRGNLIEAEYDLQRACDLVMTAEGLNNLGVVCARLGQGARAVALFEEALALLPGYADARENRAAPAPVRITSHPLRVEPARQDYAARASATLG